MRVRRIPARTQSITQLRIQSMLPQVTFEAAASLLVSGPEPWDGLGRPPPPALTPWRRFGSWVLTRHTANAERARNQRRYSRLHSAGRTRIQGKQSVKAWSPTEATSRQFWL